MLFDNNEEKTGLKKSCDLINNEVNNWLSSSLGGKALDAEML
jgi:hypothetical protein